MLPVSLVNVYCDWLIWLIVLYVYLINCSGHWLIDWLYYVACFFDWCTGVTDLRLIVWLCYVCMFFLLTYTGLWLIDWLIDCVTFIWLMHTSLRLIDWLIKYCVYLRTGCSWMDWFEVSHDQSVLFVDLLLDSKCGCKFPLYVVIELLINCSIDCSLGLDHGNISMQRLLFYKFCGLKTYFTNPFSRCTGKPDVRIEGVSGAKTKSATKDEPLQLQCVFNSHNPQTYAVWKYHNETVNVTEALNDQHWDSLPACPQDADKRCINGRIFSLKEANTSEHGQYEKTVVLEFDVVHDEDKGFYTCEVHEFDGDLETLNSAKFELKVKGLCFVISLWRYFFVTSFLYDVIFLWRHFFVKQWNRLILNGFPHSIRRGCYRKNFYESFFILFFVLFFGR